MTLVAKILQPVEQFSLKEKIAQLIFVRIGSNLPPVRTVEDDEERVATLLESCPVGGLLLFNGGPQTQSALARLQQLSGVPLLVAADIERGVGQQVKGCTLFPHAMAFEKLPRDAAVAVSEFAEASAREASGVGIHISFSPVADVNTNPNNPIIATRAFSENAYQAAELAAAYVTGAESAGLRTTAKHFPGHGDTHQDSHDSLPSVSRSLEALAACELVPFRAAIDAGCSLVMTAHVALPAIDASGVPATLSPAILQRLLRQELGFRGVICSDSLLMAGVRDLFDTEEEMALAALNAGVDLLLDIGQPSRVIEYLCQCVDDGSLKEERAQEAFERVWQLKARCFSGHSQQAPAIAAVENGSPAKLAARIARGAIEVLSDTPNMLPFRQDTKLVAILLKPFQTPIEPAEQPLAMALRERFPSVRYMQLGPQADPSDYAAAEYLARTADQLLLAIVVRPAAWYAFGLLPEQQSFIEAITQERSVVLASLGVPYALRDYPDAAVRICTYSDVPVSQQALADFLLTYST